MNIFGDENMIAVITPTKGSDGAKVYVVRLKDGDSGNFLPFAFRYPDEAAAMKKAAHLVGATI